MPHHLRHKIKSITITQLRTTLSHKQKTHKKRQAHSLHTEDKKTLWRKNIFTTVFTKKQCAENKTPAHRSEKTFRGVKKLRS